MICAQVHNDKKIKLKANQKTGFNTFRCNWLLKSGYKW